LHAIEHTIFNATPNWGVKNEFSETTITPIVHVQLIRRQELFEAEMLVVPEPHKVESTEKCRAGLKGSIVD